jgi:hypothetical protein
MSHRDAIPGQTVWTRDTCERVTIRDIGHSCFIVRDFAGTLSALDAFDVTDNREEALAPLLRAGRPLHFTAAQS